VSNSKPIENRRRAGSPNRSRETPSTHVASPSRDAETAFPFPDSPRNGPGKGVIEVLRRHFPAKDVIAGVLTGQFPGKKFM